MGWQSRTAGVAVAALLAVAPAAGAAATGAAGASTATARTVASATHHFRGSVRATSSAHHRFRLRTVSGRSVRVYTSRATRWSDCTWRSLRAGRVDVYARRVGGRWVATRLQFVPRQLHGTVTGTHASEHWFTIRTTSGHDVRIDTNGHTAWSDCSWSEMHHGHGVDVVAHREDGRWVATRLRSSGHDAHDGDGGHDG